MNILIRLSFRRRSWTDSEHRSLHDPIRLSFRRRRWTESEYRGVLSLGDWFTVVLSDECCGSSVDNMCGLVVLGGDSGKEA